MSLFDELKRRNVVRVGLLYAVGGWVILQFADVLAGLLSLPDWTLRLVAFLLVLGFPLVLVFSWVFELTPEGIQRESELPSDRTTPASAARKFNLAVGLMLAIAVLLLLANFASRPGGTEIEPATSTTTVAPPTPPGYSVETAADQGKALPPATSIAVLPFVNMSSDPENDFFADGLSEELLNVLAQIEGFKVAGRTSSFTFKGKNQDLKEIGQTLNVGTVLEGSVRKSGDQIRVTAQLISVNDGYHLWSASYDRKLDDIFSIQDDIARQVVGALKKTLLASQDKVILDKRPTNNLQAYQLYLRGRHQLAKRTQQGFELALAAFKEAVALDPEFARAWTGIADAQSLMSSYGYKPIGTMKEDAELAIENALRLDPDMGEAYASKGLLLTQLSGETKDIVALYEKALELNPNNSLAHMWLAGQLGLSDLDGTVEHLRTAYTLDPLSGVVILNLANILMVTGHPDEARRRTEELLQLDPTWPGAQRLLAQNAISAGDAYGWIQGNLHALELDPNDNQTLESLGDAFLSLGDLEMAESYIRRARKISPDYSGTAGQEALLLYLRGEHEAGLKLIRDMVARQPTDKRVLVYAAYAESYTDQPERALTLCRQFWGQEQPPATVDKEHLGALPPCIYALRISGQLEQAQELANTGAAAVATAQAAFDVWDLPFMAARIAAAAGDRDTALAALRTAIQKNMPPLVFPLDPWFVRYRDDPDFKPLFDELAHQADALYAKLTVEGLTSGKRVTL
ncbi:MAG: tetratricopeptide repeat protein [Gammaproteobacteria bacterium]|nr:tetratricopeptide repeat protein [Gammaproteobacteria bacterium]